MPEIIMSSLLLTTTILLWVFVFIYMRKINDNNCDIRKNENCVPDDKCDDLETTEKNHIHTYEKEGWIAEEIEKCEICGESHKDIQIVNMFRLAALSQLVKFNDAKEHMLNSCPKSFGLKNSDICEDGYTEEMCLECWNEATKNAEIARIAVLTIIEKDPNEEHKLILENQEYIS